MEYGANYRVTYRWAVNKPEWTKTETLRFCGTQDDQAVFEDADPWNQRRKPFGLTLDRIVSIEEAEAE